MPGLASPQHHAACHGCSGRSSVPSIGHGPPLGARPCVRAAAKKPKPQAKKVRKPRAPVPQRIRLEHADADDDGDGADAGGKVLVVNAPSGSLPAAPHPNDAGRTRQEPRPEDLYQVFKPQPLVTPMDSGSSTSTSSTSTSSSSSSSQGPAAPAEKWSWDEPGPSRRVPVDEVTPLWNPWTGFGPPPESKRAQSSHSSSGGGGDGHGGGTSGTSGSSSSSSSGGGSGGSSGAAPRQPSIVLPGAVSAAAADDGGEGDLPAVTAGAVLSSCFSVSGGMALFGFLLRAYAEQNAAAAMGTDPLLLQALLRVPPGFETWSNLGVALGAAAGVTGARLALLSSWPAFRAATDRSNKQVLTPLSWPDVALVALLTGASEEWLFRSGVITATYADWRGVLLSAAVFGALHNSGGRNPAFAAWAAAVGALYGGVYLATSNLWVAAGAHAAANFASAAAWRLRRAA